MRCSGLTASAMRVVFCPRAQHIDPARSMCQTSRPRTSQPGVQSTDHQGGVVILLVASFGNQDKFCLGGPIGFSTDVTLPIAYYKISYWVYHVQENKNLLPIQVKI